MMAALAGVLWVMLALNVSAGVTFHDAGTLLYGVMHLALAALITVLAVVEWRTRLVAALLMLGLAAARVSTAVADCPAPAGSIQSTVTETDGFPMRMIRVAPWPAAPTVAPTATAVPTP